MMKGRMRLPGATARLLFVAPANPEKSFPRGDKAHIMGGGMHRHLRRPWMSGNSTKTGHGTAIRIKQTGKARWRVNAGPLR